MSMKDFPAHAVILLETATHLCWFEVTFSEWCCNEAQTPS